MSAVQPQDREAAISAIHAEAGGLLRVYLFGASEGARLLLAAACGDGWAYGMLGAINDCARHIVDAPRAAPALCLTCPMPLRELPGLTFCVVVPEATNPHHVLGSAICPACAARPDLERRVTAALRQIWPDLREISVMPGPAGLQ